MIDLDVRYDNQPAMEMGVEAVLKLLAAIPVVADRVAESLVLWLLMQWFHIQVRLGIEDFLGIEHDGRIMYHPNIKKSDVLGNPETDIDPVRVHRFTDDAGGPAFFSPAKGTFDRGLFCYDWGAWDVVEEEEVIDWLVLIEIHELAHWACIGQGYEEPSGGDGHNPRWNPVLKSEVAYVRGEENSTWSLVESENESSSVLDSVVEDMLDDIENGELDAEDITVGDMLDAIEEHD